MENWSPVKKNKFAEEAKRLNKAWGKENERARREKTAQALGFEKNKAVVNNSDVSITENQSSIGKLQKNVVK